MSGEAHPVGVLSDGTAYYAPLGELDYDGEDRVRCHLCGRFLRMVGGTHLRVGHGWTIAEYRETFQLSQSAATCSRDLSERYRRSAVQRVGSDGFATPPTARGSGRVRAPRWRSLAHVHPELVAELHPTRNGDLDPETVGAGSHRKPWWRCSTCGHEWQASIANRTVRGSGCPSCGLRRRVETRSRVEPVRSIATVRPDLAAELHPSRNGALDPLTVGISSGRTLWWSCGTCGHEWEAIVSNRANGTGCPTCWSRRRGATFSVVSPERSLAQRAPQVAQELHPTRNPDLDPSVLGARSSRKVWWLCGACGHEWQARVADRTAGDRCPNCSRRARAHMRSAASTPAG